MNEMKNDFTVLCARLVDGELSDVEENQVLAMCEQFPDNYRRLALAMVERRRIGQILADVDGLTGNCDQHKGHHSGVSQAIGDQSRPATWMRATALAASLLAAVAVGYGVRDFNADEPSAAGNVAAVTGREIDLPILPNVDLPEGSDAKDPESPTSEADEKESFVNLAQQLKPTPTLDDQTVRLLSNNGVDVRRHRHVFLFDVSDGRQLAIPAEFTFLSTSSR